MEQRPSINPRQIEQRESLPYNGFTGYLHWSWHRRFLGEYLPDPTRRSGSKLIKQWPNRAAHAAYRQRKDRIPTGHWRYARCQGPWKPAC